MQLKISNQLWFSPKGLCDCTNLLFWWLFQLSDKHAITAKKGGTIVPSSYCPSYYSDALCKVANQWSSRLNYRLTYEVRRTQVNGFWARGKKQFAQGTNCDQIDFFACYQTFWSWYPGEPAQKVKDLTHDTFLTNAYANDRAAYTGQKLCERQRRHRQRIVATSAQRTPLPRTFLPRAEHISLNISLGPSLDTVQSLTVVAPLFWASTTCVG